MNDFKKNRQGDWKTLRLNNNRLWMKMQIDIRNGCMKDFKKSRQSDWKTLRLEPVC